LAGCHPVCADARLPVDAMQAPVDLTPYVYYTDNRREYVESATSQASKDLAQHPSSGPRGTVKEFAAAVAHQVEVIPVSMKELEVDWWFFLWAGKLGINETETFAEKIGLIPKGSSCSKCQHAYMFVREALRWFSGFSKHTFPALMLAIADWYIFDKSENARLAVKAEALRTRLHALLSETADSEGSPQHHDGVTNHSILVLPTLPYTRPPHHDWLPNLCFLDTCYTSIWNAMELPATQIPLRAKSFPACANCCSTRKPQLPVGCSIVGLRDEVTLAVAAYLEEHAPSLVHASEIVHV